MVTTIDPSYVNPALINPRAVRLVKAFKDFLARMRDEEGLTYDDFRVAADLVQRVQTNTGAAPGDGLRPAVQRGLPGRRGRLRSRRWHRRLHVHLRLPAHRQPRHPADAIGRTRHPSGRVRPRSGRPWSAAHRRQARDLPCRRQRQLRRAVRRRGAQVQPAITAVEGVAEACAALGCSLYRPAHIHDEVHHPDLITPGAGEIYFKGDPVIPVDFVDGTKAPLSLQADTVLHKDPAGIAAAGLQGPYRTAEFDFVLKTRTSPDTVAPKKTTA